jgi:ribosomal protein S18 acetylase RimI-like enzyme
MSSSLHIRIAEIEDAAGLAELARLNALFNGVCDSAEQIAARLANPHRVETAILAEIDGRIIGFTALRIVPCIFFAEPYAEVTELFVEENYRHQGAGRALVVHAERLAQEAGARQMLILTDFYNNIAQSLYRSMGYVHYDIALCKDLNKP